MLTIRQEQLRVLGDIQREKFDEWLLDHLKKFFGEKCRRLGDTRLRQLIQYGTHRAASYGFTSKRDTCKYLDLMMVFGRDFDKLPWADEILKKRRDPAGRMALLFHIAMDNSR